MGTKIRLPFLATIIIAAAIQTAAAQTTHTVGGTGGWAIPQGGASLYSNWAANQTFSAGDILVFNFANELHDVTKVNKSDYDACTTTSATSRLTTRPARIAVNGSGAHYFICGFPGHCNAGQKLVITDPSSSSPAAQPSAVLAPAAQPSAVLAPAPVTAAPSPTPSFAHSPASVSSSGESAPSPAETPAASSYTVGDDGGWRLTEDTAMLYERWASTKNFTPGDILVFNYKIGIHNVLEVSKADFESCNTSTPISRSKSSPTRIILTAGDHYYICGVAGHCTLGMKLAVSMGGARSPAHSTAPPLPVSSATPVAVAGLSATFVSVIVAFLF